MRGLLIRKGMTLADLANDSRSLDRVDFLETLGELPVWSAESRRPDIYFCSGPFGCSHFSRLLDTFSPHS